MPGLRFDALPIVSYMSLGLSDLRWTAKPTPTPAAGRTPPQAPHANMDKITAKTRSRRAKSLLGTPPQDLFLLVRGTEHGGQIVRLSAPRCTVGSGQSCTLRLRSAGVNTVHCLIFRGRRVTFVRRFDENTRLNGRMFDSAPLSVGDRLVVGPVELEVIDEATARRLDRRSPTAALPRKGRDDATPLHQVVEQARQQADLLRSSLAKTRHSATLRVQQLANQLRSARERLHRLQAEYHGDRERTRCVQQALTDQQETLEVQFEQRHRELEADLRRRQSELEGQAAEVETQAAELAERKRQLAADHAERQRDLETSQRQLTESREQIERQRAEAESGSSRAQETFDAESERFEEQKRQFEADRTAWQQERQRYDDELCERSVLLERRQADLVESDKELAAARDELDTLKNEIESRHNDEAGPNLQPTDAETPGFSAAFDEGVQPFEQTQIDPHTAPDTSMPLADATPPDALTDMPGAHEGTLHAQVDVSGAHEDTFGTQVDSAEPENRCPEETPFSSPMHSPRDSSSNETIAPAVNDGGQDESVEEYMTGLMQRLRGDDSPRPEVDDTPYVATQERGFEEEPSAEPTCETAPEPPSEEPFDLSEYRPRNLAPESKTDLGALREVANTSARSAIVQHSQKRSGKGAFGKTVWASMALLAAVSFGLWKFALGPIALAGAAISLVAACIWFAQAARMINTACLAKRVPQGGRVEDSLPTGE
ncbi:MAG: hypothetical protein GY725_04395 [bacterium]|nr:hypothetical protein [bacterium]